MLRLRDWGDGTGELCAEAHADGFSGKGCANFDLKKLQQQVEAFTKFPLDAAETIFIEGGYWNKDGANVLAQEHLYFGVSPLNSHGTLALRVRLGCPSDDSVRSQLRHSVSVEFHIDYQQLATFAGDLAALACGNSAEVLLSTS